MPRSLAFVCLAMLAAAGRPAAGAELPPRYRLTAGRVFTYRYEGTLTFGPAADRNHDRDRKDWTAWVLRANADGTARVLVREVSRSASVRGGKADPETTVTRIAYADVFPDGRAVPNASTDGRDPLAAYLPRLPKDAAEARSGWESVTNDVKMASRHIAADQFTSTPAAGPTPPVYLATCTFDRSRGLVACADVAYHMTAVKGAKGSARIDLIDDSTLAAGALARLAADADRYVAADAAYDAAAARACKSAPADARKTLDTAVRDLAAAAATVGQADLKAALTGRVTRHDATSLAYLAQAEVWAATVGRPAYQLDAVDLDGKTVRLGDLRGRVVVLDFWYRGCGWCLKAMPQVNQLAADFAGQPVMVLGMNTDPKKEDAVAVVKQLKLTYPTVQVDEAVPEKFGVQGMPTLVVIDQAGVVRDLHIGYSRTLRADVGKKIQSLLQESGVKP